MVGVADEQGVTPFAVLDDDLRLTIEDGEDPASVGGPKITSLVDGPAVFDRSAVLEVRTKTEVEGTPPSNE